MKAIPYNKIDRDKEKRYSSLESKYTNNPNYKLVFSKKADTTEHSSTSQKT